MKTLRDVRDLAAAALIAPEDAARALQDELAELAVEKADRLVPRLAADEFTRQSQQPGEPAFFIDGLLH